MSEEKRNDNNNKIIGSALCLSLNFDDVYTVWNWKEIKNCPGRYVLKKKIGNDLTPKQFMEQTILKLSHDIQQNENKNKIKMNNNCLYLLKETFGLKNDKIFLIFFKDGGGLMSYQKINESIVYIHTLNKPSGMFRKLTSMNVNYKFNQQSNSFYVTENCFKQKN